MPSAARERVWFRRSYASAALITSSGGSHHLGAWCLSVGILVLELARLDGTGSGSGSVAIDDLRRPEVGLLVSSSSGASGLWISATSYTSVSGRQSFSATAWITLSGMNSSSSWSSWRSAM